MTTFRKTLLLEGSFYLEVSSAWRSLSCCYIWEVLTPILENFACKELHQKYCAEYW